MRTHRVIAWTSLTILASHPVYAQQSAIGKHRIAAADSAAIMAAERTIDDALVHKDTIAVNRPMAEGRLFAQPDGIGRYNWVGGPASVLACETQPYSIDQVLLRPVGRDGAVLAYRYLGKTSCGGHALPDTTYSMAVYERSGDTWKRAATASIFPQAIGAVPDSTPAAVERDTVPLHVVQRVIAAWQRKDLPGIFAEYDSTYLYMAIGDTATRRRTREATISEAKSDTGFVQHMNTSRLAKAEYDPRRRWVFAVWTFTYADGRSLKHYDIYRVEHGKIVYEIEGG